MTNTISKRIIQRQLPLDTTYTLVDKMYVSLADGQGCTCDNCGKLIANIATISNGSRHYNIGFDCLDTILLNNAILSEIDIKDYQQYKQAISKVMKLIKRVKSMVLMNAGKANVTGIRFERAKWETDYHTFYWEFEKARDCNDNEKIKGVSIEVVYKIIKDYFKNLKVTIK